MAKLGNKLTKLKSAMKKLPSFTTTRQSRTTTSTDTLLFNDAAAADSVHKNGGGGGGGGGDDSKGSRAVYVGKSRRRYCLSSDVICHPLFQELIERSSSGGFDNDDDDNGDGGGEVVFVACEVVLFEHLLWMLESSSGTQLGSMQELVEFYTC